MPIYEYECRKCGHRFERIQKISDRRVRTCPQCRGRVDRLAAAPAIRFKGSGFYVNDYPHGSGAGSGSGDRKPGGDSSGGGESESKSDSKKPAAGGGAGSNKATGGDD